MKTDSNRIVRSAARNALTTVVGVLMMLAVVVIAARYDADVRRLKIANDALNAEVAMLKKEREPISDLRRQLEITTAERDRLAHSTDVAIDDLIRFHRDALNDPCGTFFQYTERGLSPYVRSDIILAPTLAIGFPEIELPTWRMSGGTVTYVGGMVLPAGAKAILNEKCGR